jgi:hypothetical protein
MIIHCLNCLIYEDSEDLSRLALKIVVMTREQGTGNRGQGRGDRGQGRGNRGQGRGDREEGTGKRGQGRGDREEVLGNFTFRYLCRFFFRSLTYAQVRE